MCRSHHLRSAIAPSLRATGPGTSGVSRRKSHIRRMKLRVLARTRAYHDIFPASDRNSSHVVVPDSTIAAMSSPACARRECFTVIMLRIVSMS